MLPIQAAFAAGTHPNRLTETTISSNIEQQLKYIVSGNECCQQCLSCEYVKLIMSLYVTLMQCLLSTAINPFNRWV